MFAATWLVCVSSGKVRGTVASKCVKLETLVRIMVLLLLKGADLTSAVVLCGNMVVMRSWGVPLSLSAEDIRDIGCSYLKAAAIAIG